MSAFGRVLTAMVSPMTEDRALDLDGAQRLASALIDNGCDGLVVCGTTGESPTLTHAETLDIVRVVVEAVGDRATVLAGTGKNDTAGSVELSREVQALGVDGVLVVTPYYNRPSQRGMVAHFGAIASAVDIPVMLYNIPSRTGAEILPPTVAQIVENHANVVAIKDSVNDFVKSGWIINNTPDSFALYSGDDALALPLLSIGGAGVVSTAGNLVARDMAAMMEQFATDPAKAREIHLRLLPLFAGLLSLDVNPVPLKAAMNLAGLPAGPVRAPLADADDETVTHLRELLRSVGVLLHA